MFLKGIVTKIKTGRAHFVPSPFTSYLKLLTLAEASVGSLTMLGNIQSELFLGLTDPDTHRLLYDLYDNEGDDEGESPDGADGRELF